MPVTEVIVRQFTLKDTAKQHGARSVLLWETRQDEIFGCTLRSMRERYRAVIGVRRYGDRNDAAVYASGKPSHARRFGKLADRARRADRSGKSQL